MALAFFLGMCTFWRYQRILKPLLVLVLPSSSSSHHSPGQQFDPNWSAPEGALTWISPELASVDLRFLGLLSYIVIAALVRS